MKKTIIFFLVFCLLLSVTAFATTDTDIEVNSVPDTFMDKPLDSFNVSEGLLLLIFCLILMVVLIKIMNWVY